MDQVTWNSFLQVAKVLQEIPPLGLSSTDSHHKNFVFTGGMVLKVLINRPLHDEIRPSNDIDAIVAVSRFEYDQLKERLKRVGILERVPRNEEDSVTCRFWMGETKIDIMPENGKILGFANRFFTIAHQTAVRTEVEKGFWIWHVTAPAFLATKSVAFNDRGSKSIMESKDLEDILTIFQGRMGIQEEVRLSPFEIREEIVSLAKRLLEDHLINNLYGHLIDQELLRKIIALGSFEPPVR